MIFPIICIIILISIAGFFSQEWIAFFKKILAFPGLALLVPLICISWIIDVGTSWSTWFLLRIQAALAEIETKILVKWSSLHIGNSFIQILILCVFAILPLLAYYSSRQSKRTNVITTARYRFAVVVWLIVAMVLIMRQ